VLAISNAEQMLQTVVTIRDKVISAYEDITKTSI
jgi:flagellar hook-basal body complex protein FliE